MITVNIVAIVNIISTAYIDRGWSHDVFVVALRKIMRDIVHAHQSGGIFFFYLAIIWSVDKLVYKTTENLHPILIFYR